MKEKVLERGIRVCRESIKNEKEIISDLQKRQTVGGMYIMNVEDEHTRKVLMSCYTHMQAEEAASTKQTAELEDVRLDREKLGVKK